MPAPTVQVGVVTTADVNNLATYLDNTRTGILAIGVRTTNSSTTTTSTGIGVLRLDGIPIAAGHRIEMKTNSIPLHSTVVGDIVRATIYYTTDGSTPTTSSTALNDAQLSVANTTFPNTGITSGTYTPASNQTLSVLLGVSRQSGSGNSQLLGSAAFPIELTVVDLGIDTGDVGVDL